MDPAHDPGTGRPAEAPRAEEAVHRNGAPANVFRVQPQLRRSQASAAIKIGFLCALLMAGGYAVAASWGPVGDGSMPATAGSPAAADASADGASVGSASSADKRTVAQLRYFCAHPFNLLYRMTVQTLFGLQGETVGRLPLFYSSFELQVVLRTLTNPTAAAGPAQPRAWAALPSYFASEPTAAHLYAAAMLTLPRTTMIYAWLHDRNGAFRAVAGTRASLRRSHDAFTGAVGLRSPKLAAAPSSAVGTADTASVAESEDGVRLGWWLWPLVFLCPSLVTCFMALAMAEVAPVAAAWTILASLVRAGCELRVLAHCAMLLCRRTPQAGVQCLACSHGVPFMLGCHALLVLRMLAALLPARLFAVLAYGLYGTWAPLAVAVITLLAVRPNNAQLLENAVDLWGGRRGDELGGGEADGLQRGHGGVTATVSLRRPQHHWPPPIAVPQHLQEVAESAPKHLVCPITHHILTEPAVTATGATYERSAIVEWLAKAGKDPLTGRVVSPDDIFPNIALYSAVEEYVREASRTVTSE